MQSKTHVQTLLQRVILVHYAKDSPIQINRQKSAFPPNFIHSIDSSHMMLTAIACHKEGQQYNSLKPLCQLLLHSCASHYVALSSSAPVLPLKVSVYCLVCAFHATCCNVWLQLVFAQTVALIPDRQLHFLCKKEQSVLGTCMSLAPPLACQSCDSVVCPK